MQQHERAGTRFRFPNGAIQFEMGQLLEPHVEAQHQVVSGDGRTEHLPAVALLARVEIQHPQARLAA